MCSGAVSSRVALLLRSAEAKPRFFTSVLIYKTPHSKNLSRKELRSVKGIDGTNLRAPSPNIIYMLITYTEFRGCEMRTSITLTGAR